MRSDGTRRLLEGSLVVMKLVNPKSIESVILQW